MDWRLLAGYAVVVLVVGLLLSRRRAGAERAVDKAANAAGLGVTPEIRPLLLRRIRIMRVGDLIGAAVGLALAALLVTLRTEIPVQTWAVQGTIVAGGAAGGLIGGLVATHGLPAPGRRVARDRAVRVADYISPIERAGALIGMLLTALFGVLSLTLGSADARVAVATGVAVAGWLGFELVARLLIARPQSADSALQLAWDDALRADSVRRLAGASGAVSLLSLLTATWFETHALLPADEADGVVLAILVGVVAVLVVLRLSPVRTGLGRYFRDRLWPDTVAYTPPVEVAAP